MKAIVLPFNAKTEGISLTIGIGNDIAVEMRLKKLMPNLKFFGVDPLHEDGILFEQLGQYRKVS